MYQVNKDIESVIQQDSRRFHVLLTVDDKTDITEGVKSFKLNGGSNSEDDFSVGSCVSQYATLTIAESPVPLEGHEIQIKIGAEVNDSMQYIPMGYFTCEKPKSDENLIEVTAYDRMMRMEKPCFLSLPDSTNTVAILNAISAITNVQVITSGLTSISMKKPVGYTCREVLSYISQMYGGFAICNRSGQVEIRNYTDSGYTVADNRYYDSFKHNDYLFQLQKITCYTGKDEQGEDISISVGSGIREISFSNPFMTQSMLNGVWSSLKNYAYMPGQVGFLGDPRIDPWDIITVKDRKGKSFKVPVMMLTQDYDGGIKTTIQAVGKSESEQETGFKGPNVQAQDRWNIKLALIDHAIANKLDVETANITFATIKNLNAVDAHIQNLDADYGNFKELTVTDLDAAKASIGILDANTANIKSLLSGNAGIGDIQNIHLTSQNAVIDTAVIRSVLADIANVRELLSGRIYTDQIMIGSQDGGVQISGNTQQWKDKDANIRMQAGQDANGEFNYYVADANGKIMWNALGLTADAIKDPIIKDSMVADNANIAGSKLDINSVVTEINNGDTTIKSNLIYFDDKKQSLDMVFSQMSNSVKAAQNTADQAIEAINGISSLDSISAVLSNDSHVVHTNADGSGGDFTNCRTTMYVYLGDLDVSDNATYKVTASTGLTGVWSNATHTYQVSNLTVNDGYVDIEASYSANPDDEKTRLVKRFSISKALDGRTGVSCSLKASTLAIVRKQNGTLIPANITLTGQYNDGNSVQAYSGRFKVEESSNGETFTQTYLSSKDEATKVYTPQGKDVKSIKVTLYASGGQNVLDSQNLVVLTDAEGLAEDIKGVQNAVAETNQHVTTIQTSVDGIKTDITDTQNQLHGVSDKILMYNVTYADNGNGTTTLTAHVYKAGEEVTKSYPFTWFSWYRKSETSNGYAGQGYSITVKNDDSGLGGATYIGQFGTRTLMYLVTKKDKKKLMTKKGKYLLIGKTD